MIIFYACMKCWYGEICDELIKHMEYNNTMYKIK